jgi:hypothetical protein
MSAGRIVRLDGSDACFIRMLTYELTRAGFTVAERGDRPDCALVDLDSADLPRDLPAIGYTRRMTDVPICDTVLTRPFAIETLLNALASLGQPDETAPPLPGGLLLDEHTHTVMRDGTTLQLMPAEFAVLRVLLEADGEPLSRAVLIDAMPSGTAPSSNLAEVVICTLRRKLEDAFGLRSIRTVRGVGYRFTL